jgi:hypothetical protein
MYFLFSGEGATDLGECADSAASCEGNAYLHGPMTVIVDQIVEAHHHYSLLDAGCCGLVSRSAIVDRASELKAAKKSVRLPGKRRARETRYFFNNARVLARIAKEWEGERKDDVVAVLFRDADTGTAGRGPWTEKRQSMLDGFAEEGFARGVPMITKPNSEAWLLCALRQNPYQGCGALEDRSGNPHSPHSLKGELVEQLGHPPTREELCDMVMNGRIDHRRIDMPSFNAFRERLEGVLQRVSAAADWN